MQAILKDLISPGIDNLTIYKPEELNNFCLLFQALVGANEIEGEESFNIEVCTPQWLLSHYSTDDIIIGRHLLIVFKYDFERIYQKIKQLIESCSGDSWTDIAIKVSRIGAWEFEDYVE